LPIDAADLKLAGIIPKLPKGFKVLYIDLGSLARLGTF